MRVGLGQAQRRCQRSFVLKRVTSMVNGAGGKALRHVRHVIFSFDDGRTLVVSDLDDYETFIRNRIHPIGCIASIDTSFVYGTVKKTAVIPPLT